MSEPRTTDVAPPRVLVVDDDAMVRELLKLTLEGAGCNVAVAGDGRQALEACEASRPDLIVSDIEMPGMDGLELLKTVRGDDRLRDVPMIMLSRRGEMADVVHGLSLGADDYIAKPFKVPEVIARVQSKLQRRPVPIDRLRHDLQTDALTQQAFKHELERELTRIRRNGGHCAVAAIATADMQLMGTKLSTREVAEVTAQMVQIVAATSRTTDLIGSDGDARLLLLLSDTDADGAKIALDDRARLIGDYTFTAGNERLRLTPTIGFALAFTELTADELIEQAHIAAEHSALHLDLQTNQFVPEMIAEATATRSSKRKSWLQRWRDHPPWD